MLCVLITWGLLHTDTITRLSDKYSIHLRLCPLAHTHCLMVPIVGKRKKQRERMVYCCFLSDFSWLKLNWCECVTTGPDLPHRLVLFCLKEAKTNRTVCNGICRKLCFSCFMSCCCIFYLSGSKKRACALSKGVRGTITVAGQISVGCMSDCVCVCVRENECKPIRYLS